MVRKYREPDQRLRDVNLYLYLRDPVLVQEMEKRHKAFSLPDTTASDIEGYLDTPRPENWYDLPAWERRSFAHGEWTGDERSCTLRIDKVCLKEIKYELFDDKSDRDLRIGAILDSLPGWKKGPKGRNKAYANWSMQMWVRIGSPEDPDAEPPIP